MTYTEAVDYVISQLTRSDSSITANVQQELKNAIEHYASTRFWFNESKWTMTTSSSLAEYAVPTDLLEVDSLIMTASGTKYPVEPESYAVLDALDLGNEFGRPYSYAIFGENFRFFLVPDAAYTFVILGHKRLATLSATSDTNAWLNTGLQLVSSRAIAMLELIRNKDPEAAQRAQALEDSALQRLRLQGEKFTTSRLQPSD